VGELLIDGFFDLYFYFKNKGHAYRELGVELLTTATFLNGYLDTDEPFPPTNDFIDMVKKSIDYDLTFGPPEDPESITKEKITKNFLDAVAALENVPAVDPAIFEKRIAEGIGASPVVPITRTKKAEISLLPLMAQLSFRYTTRCFALSVFYLTRALIYKYDDYAKELSRLASNGEGDVFEYWVGDSLSALKDADFYAYNAATSLGFWAGYIQELRKQKKKPRAANKKKEGISSVRRQRIKKMLDEMKAELKEMKRPYTIERLIREKRWAKNWPKDNPPGKKFIIEVIKEWQNEQ
jgi:hypothetical protein